ncbi:MAG: methyl-accepting chemotaxis protein [Treponema sp.]|nr:methyl-accepting chemotaxis protein [Treponema sp.]
MENKSVSFERKILFGGIIPNLLSAAFIYLYSAFIMGINAEKMVGTFFLLAVTVFIAQVLIAPITNNLVARSLSNRIAAWEKGESDAESRLKLFKDIQNFPKIKQKETLIYFFLCSILINVLYFFVFKVDVVSIIVSVLSCTFGTYIAGILGLLFSVKICSKYAEKIVAQGIDDKQVMLKRTFGLTFTRSFVLFIIIPIICTTVLFISTYILNYMQTKSLLTNSQLFRLVVISIVNIIVSIILTLSFFKTISDALKAIQSSMEHIIENDIFTVNLISTDLSNEVSCNMYLINKIIKMFRSVLNDVKGIGANIIKPVQNLTEIANETASTSYEQATGVKEILATMEENDTQTREIVERISDVTGIASQTTNNVEIGFETLRANLEKMNEITEANVSTITGIKILSEKIESIWEIVNIIKDISDQTRIIAFNAELEASGAGDAGKKFHIIANEVRRLAAGITDSVVQIRERITEIQHSSDNLIITSESGTEKIREGCELTANLETKFTDIKTSSEITSDSAIEIQNIIQQQSSAFDQIVTTIRQISAGIENFSASTNTVNTATARLKSAADRLENLNKEIVAKEYK